MTAAVARPSRSALGWLGLAALAVLATIATHRLWPDRGSVPTYIPLDPATLRPGFGPATFELELSIPNRDGATLSEWFVEAREIDP